MPRRKHPPVVGGIFHITNQGHNLDNIYIDKEGFEMFLERLKHTVLREHAVLLAFVLMPNHFHLLLRVTSSGFASAWRGFLISYSKSFNNRHDRVGTLYRGRYTCRPVLTEGDLKVVSRYIHINPVKDGFVEYPEAWGSSSYSDYIGPVGSGLVDPLPVLALFGDTATPDQLALSRRDYKAYVDGWCADFKRRKAAHPSTEPGDIGPFPVSF
jgi:REP element-mobilizing transposase RayT